MKHPSGGRTIDSKGADVASAGTLAPGSGNGFSVSGTTTINYISTNGWLPGNILVLEFQGSLTVTHNAASPPAGTAAILLAGAANFGATSADMLTLWYNGTVFKEIARAVI